MDSAHHVTLVRAVGAVDDPVAEEGLVDAGGVVQAGHGVVEVAVLDWDPRGRADAVGHVLKKE